MRCLYCGKQLALLKRLTGGGEFCSDAHKQSYQEEYNRLALSRLLQAQSKPGEIKTTSPKAPTPAEGLGQPLPPGASRRRALPATTPDPEPAHASTLRKPIIAGPVTVEEAAPYVPEVPVPGVPEEISPPEVLEVPEAEPVAESVETTPPEVTVFAMEIPAFLAIEDESPYVESWSDAVAPPLQPEWLALSQPFNLSLGTLVTFDTGVAASDLEFTAPASELAPVGFSTANLDLQALSNRSIAGAPLAHPEADTESEHPFSSLPPASLAPLEICAAAGGAPLAVLDVAGAAAEFTGSRATFDLPFAVTATPAYVFPAASPIEVNIRVTASAAGHQTSSNGALRFPVRIAFQNSSLLNLSPATIDFPAEDSEVMLAAPWAEEIFSSSNGTGVAEPPAEDETDASPREALQALSRLHQDLVQQQETALAPEETAPAAELELAEPEPMGAPGSQHVLPAAADQPVGATIDISAEPVEDRSIPRSAKDLFEIPVKTFAPPKPALAVESTALLSLTPEMPRLKALPLRPKVAKAPPGFSPQPAAIQSKSPAADPKAKIPAPAAPPRPDLKTTQVPVPAAKQHAPPVKSPPTVQPVKPGQPLKPSQPVKPVAAGKPPQTAKPPQTVQTPKPGSVPARTPTKQATPEHPQPLAQPAAPHEKEVPVLAGAATSSSTDGPAAPAPDVMPSFAEIQTGKNGSFVGSLKGKLVIAIVLIVSAGGAFLVWGPKSHPQPVSAPAAEDGAGPSIMLGEGGWVQNWAGDTNGSHAGRQITIYRPSLKLTDYRIEFQGEIDTKSIGWVFRAMDPYNYYAMKLAIVTPGLAPKMALIKYVVVQGHETEVGRVPLDMAVRNDSVFNVRMDVRGSKFSTYVQGQAADVWTDDQLKSGGVGFLNERAERARIKSASISYLGGGKN